MVKGIAAEGLTASRPQAPGLSENIRRTVAQEDFLRRRAVKSETPDFRPWTVFLFTVFLLRAGHQVYISQDVRPALYETRLHESIF